MTSSIGKIHRTQGSPSKSFTSQSHSSAQQNLKMIEITDPSSYDQENNPLNLNRIQHSSGQSSSPRVISQRRAAPIVLDQDCSTDTITSQHFQLNREDFQRALASENSVEDLLTFLTSKFNRLIDSLKSEEQVKLSLQRQCLEQQLKI